MNGDLDIVAIQQEIDRRKRLENANNTKHDTILDEQYEKNKAEISASEDFKNLTKEVTARSIKAQLSEDMLAIISNEQKNELAKYMLSIQKKQLDYRRKKENKLIYEEVKADIYNKKVESLKKRYGYLYKKDENGYIIDFVPSKIHNRIQEITNWWKGTSENFKKIIKGVCKILLWSAILFIVLKVGYNVLKWISANSDKISGINL